jgi:cytochrome c oxidase cbb3-type subunit 3
VALVLLSAVEAAQQGAARGSAGKSLKNPAAATPESVQAGRRIFAKECSPCHGFTGKGDGTKAPEGSKPANLTDDKWDHGATDGEIFVVIRDGVSPKFDMPEWKSKLSDQDMWNTVNFVRSLKK